MGAVEILVVVVVPVPGGEHHPRVVAHGIWQISRQVCKVNGVVSLWTVEVESVLNDVLNLSPVFQLDVKDSVALSCERVDLPEAKPKLSCVREREREKM